MASFLDSMNPQVRDYLLKKREEEQALKDSQGGFFQEGIQPALAALSAGFGGRDPMAAAQGVQKNNQAVNQAALENFRNQKADEIAGLDMSRQLAKDEIEKEKNLRESNIQKEEDDPNSDVSKMYQSLAGKYSAGSGLVGKSASQIKKILPSIEKIAELEAKKQENYYKRQDKSEKEKELSVAQAKQRGLAELGELANAQYENAIKEGASNKEYDPTSYMDWIDNSTWAPKVIKSKSAIDADAAKASWVEAYLRDASGAAIPPSERLAYAQDYFPQPGDSKTTIKNKADLRAQKERNARVASGDVSNKEGVKNTVTVSNGSETLEIPIEDLKDAIADGYKRI